MKKNLLKDVTGGGPVQKLATDGPVMGLTPSFADAIGVYPGDIFAEIAPQEGAFFRPLEPGQTVETGQMCIMELRFSDGDGETYTGPWPGADVVKALSLPGADFKAVAVAVVFVSGTPAKKRAKAHAAALAKKRGIQ